MKGYEEQTGKRAQIRWDGENYYLFISQTDIMFFGPQESDVSYQEKYSTVNLICRLVSILRNAGVGWAKILKQFDAVTFRNERTLVSRIALAVRGCGVI